MRFLSRLFGRPKAARPPQLTFALEGSQFTVVPTGTFGTHPDEAAAAKAANALACMLFLAEKGRLRHVFQQALFAAGQADGRPDLAQRALADLSHMAAAYASADEEEDEPVVSPTGAFGGSHHD